MMRRTLYASAVQECQYVLRNHPDPDFVLRPEILYRMGVYESAIESWVQAMEYFRQSIAAKPDYWPPYEGLAKIHMKLGRHDQALEVLNEGLKTNPTEPRLLEAAKRARERGGAGSRATVSR
jgi:tetratricopeptide (TPR) repeat protein